MKKWTSLLIAAMAFTTFSASAGVVIGGTRVIYDEAKKEVSLALSNPDKTAYLVQSWIESPSESDKDLSFVITPPLFRLSAGSENVLRIVRAGKLLPEGQESMYWMNIKAIPSQVRNDNKNTLQLAINTRIKLIYRPKQLGGVPEDLTTKLSWKRSVNKLIVSNPTPYFMNFQSVKLGGKDVADATFVAPMSSATFSLPQTVGNEVSWSLITDFGGIGPLHKATL